MHVRERMHMHLHGDDWHPELACRDMLCPVRIQAQVCSASIARMHAATQIFNLHNWCACRVHMWLPTQRCLMACGMHMHGPSSSLLDRRDYYQQWHPSMAVIPTYIVMHALLFHHISRLRSVACAGRRSLITHRSNLKRSTATPQPDAPRLPRTPARSLSCWGS